MKKDMQKSSRLFPTSGSLKKILWYTVFIEEKGESLWIKNN
ncbi:hypothetical protein HMPREF0556_10843 [Listeria grayi DSM 20601]|uniref:Uncharacterized protein n=1 Tax=Listeria grayi DSM 20601 TaxID=525367 RepID=D7UX82_LISGR|nr:hypothetical protein HMPREF0556_10843 [Listeria grayi DSM 20601]